MQYFQDLGQSVSPYRLDSHLANNIRVSQNLSKLVIPLTPTNKIFRFVKIPLFEVAQGMLNNFVMLANMLKEIKTKSAQNKQNLFT